MKRSPWKAGITLAAISVPVALLLLGAGVEPKATHGAFGETQEPWIVDDLSKALTRARTQKKPVMVVLRCVP